MTSPYFHDGRVASLPEAVAIMSRTQLGQVLSQDDVDAIVAFLKTLTGEYNGRLLDAPSPSGPQ
jgi:cytochrome c peroxidase